MHLSNIQSSNRATFHILKMYRLNGHLVLKQNLFITFWLIVGNIQRHNRFPRQSFTFERTPSAPASYLFMATDFPESISVTTWQNSGPISQTPSAIIVVSHSGWSVFIVRKITFPVIKKTTFQPFYWLTGLPKSEGAGNWRRHQSQKISDKILAEVLLEFGVRLLTIPMAIISLHRYELEVILNLEVKRQSNSLSCQITRIARDSFCLIAC